MRVPPCLRPVFETQDQATAPFADALAIAPSLCPADGGGALSATEAATMLDDMTLRLTSPAFADGQPIPARFDHAHGDVSPPLSWDGVPEGTAELVLLVDDPDAPIEGSFVHWVLVGLAANRTGLDEAERAAEAGHGINGFGQPGYLGPAPPAGHGTHHYVFRLLAIDQPLKIDGKLSYAEVDQAAAGHVRAEARLIGTYETPPSG
jgi:Raf kinase inhibitor-like YbhB/YbcL family protein